QYEARFNVIHAGAGEVGQGVCLGVGRCDDWRSIFELATVCADGGLEALGSRYQLQALAPGHLRRGKPLSEAPQFGLIRLQACQTALGEGGLNLPTVRCESSIG